MKNTRLVAMILLVCFIFSTFSTTVYGESLIERLIESSKNRIRFFINGDEYEIPTNYGEAYFDTNGRTQIPLRALSERLGYNVEWDSSQQIVTIYKTDLETISIKINSNTMTTSDGDITMDTQAVLGKDGRVYIPLRYIGEALGYDVKFIRAYSSFNKFGNYIYINDKDYVPERKAGINQDGLIITTTASGKIDIGGICSLLEAPGGQRPVNSTLEEDIENLNKNFYSLYNLKKTLEGATFQEIPTGQDPFAVFSISRDDGRPIVRIRDWVDKDFFPYLDGLNGERIIHGLNGVVETLKYYSVNIEDGEAIFTFIQKKVTADERIPLGKYTFGNTNIEIIEQTRGIAIIFLD